MQFVNAQIILPDSIQHGSLVVRAGRIQQISKSIKGARGADTVDVRGGYLAPGFVDLHIHGALGRDTMGGNTRRVPHHHGIPFARRDDLDRTHDCDGE
jgi:N-acetylglucosamine-6-phosphate deacetylase